MQKTALFLLTLLSISLLSCVFSLSINLKNRKSKIKKSNLKKIKTEDEVDYLNFTNLYPIIDKEYEKSWEAASNSDDARKNKIYFCQNLTLAAEIEQNLTKQVRDFEDSMREHRNHLEEIKDNKYGINNEKSGYDLKKTNKEYEEFLDNVFEKYNNKYKDILDEIEKNLENGKIFKNLHNLCTEVNDDPIIEPKPNPEDTNNSKNNTDNNNSNPKNNTNNDPNNSKKEDKSNSTTNNNEHNDSSSASDSIDFIELKKIKVSKMNMKENKIYESFIQMINKARGILTKFAS